MKTKTIKAVLKFSFGVIILAPVVASANLVTNGSFENGNFVNNTGQDTMDLPMGSTAMTGWTTTVAELAWIGPNNPFDLTAANGNYFLDLTGYHDSAPYAGVAATSITTVSGQQYQISFDVGSSTMYDPEQPGVTIKIDGATADTVFAPVTGSDVWTTFSFDFTATSTSTTLEFDGMSPDNNLDNLAYIGLDNVNVTAVPESPTMVAGALMLLPFGMSTLRILRRSRMA
jgi:hypothetical protein